MIKIFPFRGIRYDAEKVGDLSAVVTQPYDKINDELMNTYYERHPHNFTRIIKAKVEPDTHSDNRYLRARIFMHKWLKDGILIRDPAPAIYPYYQEYTVGGVTRTRKGVTLLVNLRETEVKAHEKTLEGPKADRLNLMWATGSHTGHIFILYPDPEGMINAILDKTAGNSDPLAEAKDGFECTHRLWSITDVDDITQVQEILKPHDLFIADGHHRTETARNYMKAMDLIGLHGIGSELPENCLMTLISMDDPGLVVLPTHRYVHSVPNFNKDEFLRLAGENFDIEKFESCKGCDNYGSMLIDKVKEGGEAGRHCIGVHFKDKDCAVLTLRSENIMKALLPGDRSDAWRNLDVNVLHVALLEEILDIDAEKLAQQTNVKYYREVGDGMEALKSDPNGNALFIMNPTRVDEVKEVAMAGERMPQKSTDFFPKLLSGFIFNKIQYTGWQSDADEFFRM